MPSLLNARVHRAINAAGVPIVGVSIRDEANTSTWTVQPSSLQAAAQPTIDAFTATDPAHVTTERAATALSESRRHDIVALCALMVMRRDAAAWNAMTGPQKVQAVRTEADLWKGLREFVDDKTL